MISLGACVFVLENQFSAQGGWILGSSRSVFVGHLAISLRDWKVIISVLFKCLFIAKSRRLCQEQLFVCCQQSSGRFKALASDF